MGAVYENTNEHEQAAFYQQNQNWIMGEVENYLRNNQIEQEEGEDNNEEDEEGEGEENREEEQEQEERKSRSGAYNLRH